MAKLPAGEIAFGLTVLASSPPAKSPSSRLVICVMMPPCLAAQKANGETHQILEFLSDANSSCLQ